MWIMIGFGVALIIIVVLVVLLVRKIYLYKIDLANKEIAAR